MYLTKLQKSSQSLVFPQGFWFSKLLKTKTTRFKWKLVLKII